MGASKNVPFSSDNKTEFLGESLNFEFTHSDINILIVDDHGHIRKAMLQLLRRAGVENIFEASDGAKAIKVIDDQPVDLILCDIYMPNVDGFELLTHVRGMDVKNDIPIIMVSGEANRADIVKATELGASDYILKPFKKDEFLEKVQQTAESYFNPQEYLKLLRNAESFLAAKNISRALELAKSAHEQDSLNHRARHILALALKANGEQTKALELLEDSIEFDPDHYRFHATKANILFELKRNYEAIETMGRELQLNPKQAKRQILMAKYQLQGGNPQAAIEHFREALKENPKLKKGLLGMAEAFYQNNDLEKCIYYLLRYRRQHPQDSKPLIAIVKYCKLAKQEKRAEYAIKSEISAHPKRLDAYLILAMFYIATNNESDALSALDNLFKKDPDNVDGLRLRGNLHFDNKRFDQAEKDYASAAKLSPSLDTLVPLAKVRLKLKKPKAFYSACKRAFMFGSTNGEVVRLLAQAYLAIGQPTKAYLLTRKAMILGEKGKKIKKLAETARASLPQGPRQTKNVAS